MDGFLKARTLFEEESKAPPTPQEKPFLAKEYKRIAQSQSAQAPYGPWLPAHTQPDNQTTSPPLSRRIHQQRFDQEHIITMSRMSLFGLISGLMLLGILFFTAGFLVALGTLEPPKPPMAQSNSWDDMNTSPTRSSTGAQSQQRIFASMARQQLSQASTNAVTKFVPKPLQPFAQQLKSQETTSAYNAAMGGRKAPKSVTPQQPAQQPTEPMPGDIQQAQGMQPPWPQQPQQAYGPTPAAAYGPPPPPTYTPPPYPQY